jgi:hypothetical protein
MHWWRFDTACTVMCAVLVCYVQLLRSGNGVGVSMSVSHVLLV